MKHCQLNQDKTSLVLLAINANCVNYAWDCEW